mmetsp:Transcript_40018/g.113411  ORF Transcript_40018/g.113411 Transcript_40018/m.113411 type:complete len:271 (+) Transcript_40018:60-872(+)
MTLLLVARGSLAMARPPSTPGSRLARQRGGPRPQSAPLSLRDRLLNARIVRRNTTPRAAIELYGSQGTRSPLVNWYLHEIGCDFEMKDPRDPANPHPFGQVPALRDGNTEVFESGAILAYIADAYGGADTPEKRAKVVPWLMWANSTLDPCLFIETPKGRVLNTGARGAAGEVRALDRLEAILREQNWLLGDEFSVADVAVGSYLLYVPQFFRDVNMGKWPSVSKYMLRCASRDAYAMAYQQEAPFLRLKCQEFIDNSANLPSTRGFKLF